MRVLFIYSNQVRDLLPAPPIGLSYVATATKEAGHEVEFLDLLLTSRGLRKLRQSLKRYQPEVIGISVRNIDNVVHQRLKTHLDELGRQIAIIREESRAAIVLGGPAISILREQALQCIDADYAIVGEGEETFPQLLKALDDGEKEPNISGLCSRTKSLGAPIIPQRLAQFGSSGMERWISWRNYERLGGTWPIQCKRGCPFHCTYCTYPTIEGAAIRRRSPKEVVEEIREVSRTVAPRCFEFIDSVFNVPEKYAIELCEEIIRADLKINLTTMGVNPRSLSKELLALMKRAGFNSMMVTPESASDPILDKMRKGFGAEEVLQCAELVKASGIPSMWFFMLGAEGETKATAEETVSFAEQHLRWDNCLPMFTTGIRILPGTELAQHSLADGYLPQDQDFAESVFYFSPQVSEEWLLQRINRAIAVNPNIVHASEDPAANSFTGQVYKLMHLFGVSPPYWRFLPRFLSLGPVHRSRLKNMQ